MTKGLLITAYRINHISKNFKENILINMNLRAYYVKYRNKFTSILRTSKIHYYKFKFSENIYNPKLT